MRLQDIFRKYPNRYESIIATLCENLDTLDEPEAKASMVRLRLFPSDFLSAAYFIYRACANFA
jgi:hypothetical protein